MAILGCFVGAAGTSLGFWTFDYYDNNINSSSIKYNEYSQ